jgi:hypothetical protein
MNLFTHSQPSRGLWFGYSNRRTTLAFVAVNAIRFDNHTFLSEAVGIAYKMICS